MDLISTFEDTGQQVPDSCVHCPIILQFVLHCESALVADRLLSVVVPAAIFALRHHPVTVFQVVVSAG